MLEVNIVGSHYPRWFWTNLESHHRLDELDFLLHPPTEFRFNHEQNDLVFICDEQIPNVDSIPGKKKVAWVLEGPGPGHPETLFLQQNYDKFDYVLSCYRVFEECGKFGYVPYGNSFIEEKDFGVHQKTQNTSIIVSHARGLPGHALRHDIISDPECTQYIDFIKHGGPFGKKIDFLRDYRFSIVIENRQIADYFSEKLIDAFVTGTVPVYFGCPEQGLKNHFNMEGIIYFNSKRELYEILPTLNSEVYMTKLEAVYDNYQRAMNYLFPWKYIYEHIQSF